MSMDKEIFKTKAARKHKNRYNYDLITTNPIHKDKVKIICPEHGIFEQNVNSHLLRSGCPTCGKLMQATNRMNSRDYYIQQIQKIHNYKYDYSLIDSNPKAKDKVKIICPEHGIFEQQLNDHRRGHGCNKCARELASKKTCKGLKHFLSRCRHIHGTTYNYDNIKQDVKIKDQVLITCNKHGPFIQVLDAHLAGSGCPLCAQVNHSSHPEIELRQLLSSYNINFVINDRTIISPKEIDILIPSHNIAIEYCGLYWHSETRGKTKNYHKNKMLACTKKGVRLITIFEDEWIHKKQQVINKLLSVLGKSQQQKVFARKCTTISVNKKEKQDFFNENHIQGDGLSSINLGLEYNGRIVAVMGFMIYKNCHYLTRYATSISVVGGFSKLVHYYKTNFDWKQLVSFADLRWSVGNVYKINGWTLDCILPPDYSYVKGNKRIHKFNYRRKQLSKLLNNFNEQLSEKQNCDNNGILRIWDCGKQRWIMNN